MYSPVTATQTWADCCQGFRSSPSATGPALPWLFQVFGHANLVSNSRIAHGICMHRLYTYMHIHLYVCIVFVHVFRHYVFIHIFIYLFIYRQQTIYRHIQMHWVVRARPYFMSEQLRTSSSKGEVPALIGAWTSEMPKVMDPILPILSIWGYWIRPLSWALL